MQQSNFAYNMATTARLITRSRWLLSDSRIVRMALVIITLDASRCNRVLILTDITVSDLVARLRRERLSYACSSHIATNFLPSVNKRSVLGCAYL